MLFRQKFRPNLEQSPVHVNLGEGSEDNYRLKPLDPSNCARTKELKTVISLMKTKEDWNNLLPFLAGLTQAKRLIRPEDWQFIIRKAGDAGVQSILFKCAVQAHRTNFSLGFHDIARAFFYVFHQTAESAGFKGPELEWALRKLKQTAQLMNNPYHSSKDATKPDPQQLPDIIGVVLELSAARSLYVFEGQDKEGEVRSYAQKLLSTWELGEFDISSDWGFANTKLQQLLPLWNGINFALKVKEVQNDQLIKNALSARQTELEKSIDSAIKLVQENTKGSPRIGLLLAERLYHK